LQSRNGTFVNGQKIDGRIRLYHGDLVQFGDVPLTFEGDEVGPPAPDQGAGASAPPPEAPATAARTAPPAPLPGAGPSVPQPAATSRPLGGASAAEPTFNVDFTADEGAMSTIQGTVAGASRFGMLDAQPEAKLKAVLDISTSLAGTVDLQTMLPKILDTLFGVFTHADRGCILLKDEASGDMIPRAFKHRRESEDATVRLSRAVVSKVLDEKTGILSADAATDSQFSQSQSIADLRIRSMMCVPMLGLDGEPRGIISIDSQNPLGQFKKDDLDLLMAVAGQAALSYETARLMQVYAEKQQQDSEMAIARDVQRALLPPELPQTEAYNFFASYDAAYAVGGDYFDSFLLPGDKICLSFGDVAGKGVPGALIMSRLASCVQSTMQFSHEVGEAIGAINNHMCHASLAGRFVTYVLMIIDLKTHEMSVANGGHMSPLIRKADRTIEEMDPDKVGPPVGVVEDYPYEVDTRVLEPGDTVVVVTDGVDEAMNPAGDLYTTERMVEFVRNGPENAAQLGKALLADVRQHAAGHPQSDDITIMTFGRNA
jgi:serine phosphatase RsbU (regulator of sigma subunit)